MTTNQQLTRRSVLVGALASAGALALAHPAAAASDYAPVVHGHGDALHPESTSWDRRGRRFLIGSLHRGTVSTVRADGRARTLVTDPVLVSTLGIKADPARGRLLVCNGDPAGKSVHSTAATQGRVSGLGAYDLATGRRLWYADLAADGGTHLANDVVVAPDGTAYVTDSFAPVVHRITPDGRPSVLVRNPRLGVPAGQFGLNGIVLEGRRLLVGNYATGSVWCVPLDRPGDLYPVVTDERLVGLDGVTPVGPGHLLGVTNAVGSSTAGQLVSLRSTDGWRTAHLTARPWADPAPTAVTVGPEGRAYVLSGRLDVLFGGGVSDEFTLRRV
ncbi:SMP-30/gluconolactonase/LRE family protein [Kitasatospora viridis]|uniref:Sugar lactone lactonase YvrE n=1 Tax=Kitasatospora viridis TaxID=281105 RepID=A0A561UMI6_9ACTN|nr:SMP-30/gluconolactonase/LRE family protein [Kitasatospora viridis]TWG00581.1 hypothetical protein FHX73_114461 [Kitasatospora viridis]